MESNNITYETLIGAPGEDLLNSLSELYEALFEDADIDFFTERIRAHEKLLTIVARTPDKLIGLKIGYPVLNQTFYSWVGGVLPSFRNQGVGTKLSEIQETWARKNKFSILKTKSMNRFKPMMMLNLKRGFDITKVYTNEIGQTKIVFKKPLD